MNKKSLAILLIVVLTYLVASYEPFYDDPRGDGFDSAYDTGYSLGYYIGHNACQYDEPYNDDVMAYPFFFELEDNSGKRIQAYIEGVNDGLNEGFLYGYQDGWDDCARSREYD